MGAVLAAPTVTGAVRFNPMNLRFDCVFYYVRNLDSAVRFYRDVLGLPLGSVDVVARFDVDGVLLELVPAQEPAQLSGQGNARLALRVDDIDRAVSDLRGRGVPVGWVLIKENGRLAAFQDPDGNELILWEYSS
jgi:catechol 2,3-dioxygenase-like lactoylglutathione lyase family enzyme